MIKGTSTKYKKPENRLQSLEKRGFIRLFVVIVIVSIILIFLGLDPKGIWENIIKPIVEWGFDITIKIVGLLFDVAIWIINKSGELLGL